ncbi:MAG: CopG family transcriptional regulator [Candidatus Woesearchaeota archaeon]
MKRPKRKDENKVKYGTISLPMPLINMIKKRIRGTGMNSVSAYIAFILRQILSSSESKETFSKKDEEEIKKRLKSLGYL